jgi:hypothetical protein
VEKKACQVVAEDEQNAVSAAKKSGAEPAVMVAPRKFNTQWRSNKMARSQKWDRHRDVPFYPIQDST